MMNKFYVTCLFTAFLLGAGHAKAEQRLVKVIAADEQVTFSYLPNGFISKQVQSARGNEAIEMLSSTFTYETNKITQLLVDNTGLSTLHERRTSVLSNGLITEETLEREKEGVSPIGGVVQYQQERTYRYRYDAQKRVTEITATNRDNDEVRYAFVWQGGNVTKVDITVNGHNAGYIEIVHYNVSADKYLAMFYNPVLLICSYAGILPYGQTQAGFYGVQPSSLVRRINFRVNTAYEHRVDVVGNDLGFSYETNADGKVKTIRTQEASDPEELISLEWSVATGIRHTECEAEREVAYYDLGGRRVPQRRHGLMIAKDASGKARKILNR